MFWLTFEPSPLMFGTGATTKRYQTTDEAAYQRCAGLTVSASPPLTSGRHVSRLSHHHIRAHDKSRAAAPPSRS
jgi:hypothetical protein